jgi:hypothetical protein
MFGGSGGMLPGLSGIFLTDFARVALGIAPEIGFGIGRVNLLYRYNFYTDPKFNCHETALILYFFSEISN